MRILQHYIHWPHLRLLEKWVIKLKQEKQWKKLSAIIPGSDGAISNETQALKL